MAVVARTGQTLGRDRAVFATCARLENVKKSEAHCLLNLGITVQLHIGPLPEFVQVHALLVEQALPAGVPRSG